MSTPVDEIDNLQQLKQDYVKVCKENESLQTRLHEIQQQLDWFQRQLFGRKSEKRTEVDSARQADLFKKLNLEPLPKPDEPTEEITYTRRKKLRGQDDVTDSGLRFDDSVPVEVITLTADGIDGLSPDEYEIIGEKVTHRLAQRPGSQVVLKYVRPVAKLKKDETIHTAPMPESVLEKSTADVSVLAGLLVDKFVYHLPLYRQHQRLINNGITLSRTTLTNWVARCIDLLGPIVDAQMVNVLLSRVLAMDETPIKAGRKHKGKMRQAYIWPVYGDADEVVFRYTSSRAHKNVEVILGDSFSGTIVSDGYKAYEKFAEKTAGVTQAQCWAHSRRYFERALDADSAAEEALTIIGELYKHENIAKEKNLQGEDKLNYRTKHMAPIVDAFWTWCDQQCQRNDLVPSDKLTKALNYVMARQAELQVFLADPDVPLDTNHLERELRVIPMGRKAWLFAWTEIGAERIAIIQSLMVTCKLHGVNPYEYLVDVLQRISQHPAKLVHELTPRIWKTKFGDNPLRSDLDRITRQ